MVAELERECDYLIVDTPPSGIVSDAEMFARCVDAAVIVVRQDYARIDRILSAVESMADTGVHILGYAINGARADQPFVAVNCGALPRELITG